MKIDFKGALAEARKSSAYWTERAIIDYTSSLWAAMRGRDVNQAELAAKVGKQPAYVSRVLNGASNVTIRTMVELAHSLDARLCISIVDEGSDWLVFEEKPIYMDDGNARAARMVSKKIPLAANEEELIAA